MPHSFKLKMALFSACTSGAILLAFALLFLSMIRRVGLERLDRLYFRFYWWQPVITGSCKR